MAPMPSISAFKTSPGLSFSWNSGESGFPVVIRSPGYKVVTCDKKLTCVAISSGSHVEHDRVAENRVKGLIFVQVASSFADDDTQFQFRKDRISVFGNQNII